ncbi:MAG: tRNA adenosine(34) deaminase TadA [Acidobacteria bacterium]|nr:tRNA adenosine(34) deaminase TadA [Acidobacteriota bacterium]MDA1237052.1 tRNA adenosine(34) deaminase TadA [Acidobacteriota bacterium]
MLADEDFMRVALELAAKGEREGEVPVGAVVVLNGAVVGGGHNRPIAANDPTAHAEIVALRAAAAGITSHRLDGCDLYVTMEPCAMCAGALVTARIRRLVFGTRDIRFGAVRSKFRIADSDLLNHRVEVVEGVLAAECVAPLQRFFAARRGE